MKNQTGKLFKRKWRRRDVMILLERLELYCAAGLALDRTLRIAEEGMKKQQQLDVHMVRMAVESGMRLSQSLSKYVGLSATSSALIEHGESSGQLAPSLNLARTLMEREDELLKKCLSAMAYPSIIGIFASLLTIGLVKGVMPQIIPLLKSLHVELPLLTRIVIFLSEGLLQFGIYIGVALVCVYAVLIFAYKKSHKIRGFIHASILHVPLLGALVYEYSITVFLRSCGSLIESGVPIAKAYSDTVITMNILPLRRQLQNELSHLQHGKKLGSVLRHKKLPAYISPLILAGEASGTLGISLVRAATILDRDIEHALKRITALIEPVMMAAMGIGVGSIALSIMMPIYDVSRVLQK